MNRIAAAHNDTSIRPDEGVGQKQKSDLSIEWLTTTLSSLPPARKLATSSPPRTGGLDRPAQKSHSWRGDERYVVSIGTHKSTLQHARAQARLHAVPSKNQFHMDSGPRPPKTFGSAAQPGDNGSLSALTLEHRLDVHVAHGATTPDQLAQRLHTAGLRRVGVLKLQGEGLGAGAWLSDLKTALVAQGVQVGYLSAPTGKVRRLPVVNRAVVSKGDEAVGLQVLKGNAEVTFAGTRYDLAADPVPQPEQQMPEMQETRQTQETQQTQEMHQTREVLTKVHVIHPEPLTRAFIQDTSIKGRQRSASASTSNKKPPHDVGGSKRKDDEGSIKGDPNYSGVGRDSQSGATPPGGSSPEPSRSPSPRQSNGSYSSTGTTHSDHTTVSVRESQLSGTSASTWDPYDDTSQPGQVVRSVHPLYVGRDIAAAEVLYRQAAQAFNRATEDGSEPDPIIVQALTTAQSNYLTEAAAHLYEAMQVPFNSVPPSTRQWIANSLGALASNTVGFTMPTLAAALAPPEHFNKIYSAGVALAGMFTPDLQSMVRRRFGGAAPALRLSVGDTANVGPYKNIAGDFGLMMLNLTIYAVLNTVLSFVPPMTSGAAGRVGKAAMSGFGMSFIGQGFITLLAQATLDRNGVTNAKYLPVATHNRTQPDGVYLKNDPLFLERTTLANKAAEVAARTMGALVGAAAMYGTMQVTSDKGMGPPAKAFADIMAGVGLFFAMGLAARAAHTHLDNHPGKHANKFAIAASDIVSGQIARSGMKAYENLLDELGMQLDDGVWGREPKEIYDGMVSVFSERSAFKRNDGAMDWLAECLSTVNQAHKERTGVRTGVNLPTEGTMAKIASTLDRAIDSLKQVAQNVREGVDYSPFLKDAKNRLRDVEAMLLMSMYQLGGPDHLSMQDKRVKRLTDDLTVAFAALRTAERLNEAAAITSLLRDYSVRKDPQLRVLLLRFLRGPTHSPGSPMLRDIVKHIERTGQDKAVMVQALATLANDGHCDMETRCKIALLTNTLNKPDEDSDEEQDEVAEYAGGVVALEAFHDVDPSNRKAATEAMNVFLANFEDHSFSLDGLLEAQTRLTNESKGGPSATFENAPDANRARKIRSNFLACGGRELLKMVQEELSDKKPDKVARKLLVTLWAEAQKMPEARRALMVAAMGLPTTPIIPKRYRFVLHKQNDSHFHPSSYSGKVNNLELTARYMEAHKVRRSVLMGIPSQVYMPTAERKYYANSDKGIDYRDHDMALADRLSKLSPEMRAMFDLAITGIDITNRNTIQQEINHRMRAYPGMFKLLGEVTMMKEIVTAKNPHRPELDSSAFQELLECSAHSGLPVVVHNDISEQGGKKDAYAGKFVAALKEHFAKMLNWTAPDPLEGKPRVHPIVVWPHAAGLSRFTPDSASHTLFLDNLLRDPGLPADNFFVDLSWDFIAEHMLKNVHDLFKRRDMPPTLLDGIQVLLKTYKAYTDMGGFADKCDDLGDLRLAAYARIAAENFAEHYFKALADFQNRLRGVLQSDPKVVNKLVTLMTQHGNSGNNWLYVLNQHADRLLYGSDALAVGIKAHGDSAYAMNTRVLEPIYTLFEEVANADVSGAIDAGVVDQLCRGTYEKVFHNPKVEARRKEWEKTLKERHADDWSAKIKPMNVVGSDESSAPSPEQPSSASGSGSERPPLTKYPDMVLGMAKKKPEEFTEYSPATSRSSSVQRSEGSTTPSPIKSVIVNVDNELERPQTLHEWADYVPQGWTHAEFQAWLDNELGSETQAESSTMAQKRPPNS
jgi:hypothetical protein